MGVEAILEEAILAAVAVMAGAAVVGGAAVMDGVEVATAGTGVMDGVEVGMGAAGMEVVHIGMVVLLIGGGIIHTLMGRMVGKRLLEVRKQNEPWMDADLCRYGRIGELAKRRLGVFRCEALARCKPGVSLRASGTR